MKGMHTLSMTTRKELTATFSVPADWNAETFMREFRRLVDTEATERMDPLVITSITEVLAKP